MPKNTKKSHISLLNMMMENFVEKLKRKHILVETRLVQN